MSDSESDIRSRVFKAQKERKAAAATASESEDLWKIDPVTPENPLEAPLEESSFATLFPKYREKYLREIWPLVTRTLKGFGIDCELNLIEGSMSVKTTRKMIDPYMIIKARDLIKLLSRSIPVQQALKILEDGIYCDIIKIKGMVSNKDRFARRRSRLLGPNGATLKAIELVTDCYVMVQGNTVSVMGAHTKLKQVRRIVIDCMNNIHPIYRIKEMMIRKELEKDDNLKVEDWERFIPKFKKKNVKTKKVIVKEKVEYNPFPPAQMPRKEDIEMETGEYWIKKDKAAMEKIEIVKKKEIAEEKAEVKKAKEQEVYIAPSETKVRVTSDAYEKLNTVTLPQNSQERKKKRKNGVKDEPITEEKPSKKVKKSKSKSDEVVAGIDVGLLKAKFKNSEEKIHSKTISVSTSDYVAK